MTNLNPLSWTNRSAFFAVFLICMGLMGYAFYSQYILKFEPCMLCMVQRVFVVMVGVFALMASAHNPKTSLGWKAWGTLVMLASLLGAYIAGRHVYLQHLPPEQLEGCAPSFKYALENYEALKFLQTIFIRDQDCGKIDWVFLGLSMPNWVLIFFVVFAISAVYFGFRKPLRK